MILKKIFIFEVSADFLSTLPPLPPNLIYAKEWYI